MPHGDEILNLNKLNLPDLSWHDQAFCSKYTGKKANWNADAKARTDRDGPIKAAVQYCKTRCPVVDQCRDWIMRLEAESGYAVDIYGGMTPLERRNKRICPVCFKGVLEVRGDDPVGPNGQKYNGKYCSDECQTIAINRQLKYRERKRRGEGNYPMEYHKRGQIGA
jgi:hypothetical protein